MSRILLGASASAALHKACDLASKLAQQDHHVRAVLTPRAAELISPQLFEALTGEPARTDEFDEAERSGGMDHISLSQWTELIVVAPATADLVGRLAHGLGGDLLTTAILAVPQSVPRLLCPAMNPHMLATPSVARNLAQLVEDGWRLVEPGEGHMACGVEGKGRLAEPPQIIEAVRRALHLED